MNGGNKIIGEYALWLWCLFISIKEIHRVVKTIVELILWTTQWKLSKFSSDSRAKTNKEMSVPGINCGNYTSTKTIDGEFTTRKYSSWIW